MKEKAFSLLKKFYGYSSFRPGQYEIIEAACRGRDTIVLMPTGGGKSLCYQLPALMLEGCALVVSPLIALMEDQTEALVANGIPAAAIHSNSTETHNREVVEEALKGRIKLIYVSPERLLSDLDIWVKNLPVSLIAIDEAHCISQWGHDFRPVYTQLAVLKERFPDVPMMALTATADRLTRDDISGLLNLKNPLRWIGSFDRPNLSIRVIGDATKKERVARAASLIRKYPNDAGIIYTLSRKGAEDMYESLQRLGFRAAVYHAGMSASARAEAQRAFTNGDVQAVCATIAFGMGIDKSNIRWVMHNNLPGNIECYYQEIGRAGRDGLPSETILFHSYQDIITRRRFLEDSGQPQIAGEKLRAMEQYADAKVCRRRILLSYFNEAMEHDCGNCDICLNPPQRFNGSVLVQKAASAVIRLNSQIGVMTLVDVLRGSARAEITQKGFDRIPTFGVGRDLSVREWSAYIGQMIQLGIFDVAFDDGNKLRVTPFGMKVTRGQATVELSRYTPEYMAKGTKHKAKEARISTDPVQLLFDQLKAVRRDVAAKAGIPPEAVFNDASLLDMARTKPSNMEEFMKVSGVSEVKGVKYGKRFITVIRKFTGLSGHLPQGTSTLETLYLHNAGIGAGEIARIKGIGIETVKNHIAKLIEEGMVTEYSRYITLDQFKEISALLNSAGEGSAERLRQFGSGTVAIVRAIMGRKDV